VCTEEFELTPENARRLKFAKWKGQIEKKIQIRTEAADMANTVLKMACKRAMIAMTLNVTAASDIFTQDIEDLPEELRQHEAAAQQQPQPKEEPKKPIDGKAFTNAMAAIKAGQYDAQSMRGYYELTQDQETALADLEKELTK